MPCCPPVDENLGIKHSECLKLFGTNCGFCFISDISRYGKISSCHFNEPASQNKHIFVFAEHRAVQEVILAYIVLKPNGSTGLCIWRFSFSLWDFSYVQILWLLLWGWSGSETSPYRSLEPPSWLPFALFLIDLWHQSTEEPAGIIAIH